MHSNISLRYLPGTGMYFRYFWLLWGPYFFCRGFRRARNRGFFAVTASFLGCFRSPVKLLCIQCIQIIFWGNYQVLAYISRVFATFEIHTGSVWASKRAWNWAFLPFLPLVGLFSVPIRVHMHLIHSNVSLNYLLGNFTYLTVLAQIRGFESTWNRAFSCFCH